MTSVGWWPGLTGTLQRWPGCAGDEGPDARAALARSSGSVEHDCQDRHSQRAGRRSPHRRSRARVAKRPAHEGDLRVIGGVRRGAWRRAGTGDTALDLTAEAGAALDEMDLSHVHEVHVREGGPAPRVRDDWRTPVPVHARHVEPQWGNGGSAIGPRCGDGDVPQLAYYA